MFDDDEDILERQKRVKRESYIVWGILGTIYALMGLLALMLTY